MRLSNATLIVLLSAGLGACTPALDWRDVRPEGSGAVAQFPCKPDRHARTVPIAGQTLRMEMLVCSADGLTFALSFVDVAQPDRVGPVLDALRLVAVGNIGAREPAVQAARVPGMTPHASSVRLAATGRLPDGTTVQHHSLLFSRGLRVYQASVVGNQLLPEATDTFFSTLRLPV